MPDHSLNMLGPIVTPQRGAVIQREGETATIAIRAEASASGRLFARLRTGNVVLPQFDWRPIGESGGNIAEGELPGVPVGGEYTLDLQLCASRGEIIGEASVHHLLVGDLWVLGGQSNMDGCGKLVGTEPPSRWVHAFYYDDRWDVARDPLCWYDEAVDPVHWRTQDPQERIRSARNDRLFRQQGAGPAVAFGRAIFRRTGVPIGLIVCSHGGTSMAQWDPARRDEGGRSLYGSMVRRVQAVGGKVTGMLWYQGESDANAEAQPHYRRKMREFVAAVRRDFNAPRLPFIYVQIGPFFAGAEVAPHWNALQADQLALEEELAPAAMAAVIDLSLDDLIHLSTASQRRLGRRLAHLAEMLVYGRAGLRRGPRPTGAEFADARRTVLRVHFAEVNGGLRPKRGIRGFWVRKEGRDLPILSQSVDPARPDTVLLRCADPVPPGSELWHGLGVNPVVNLTDEADMAVPVFGPLTL